MEKNPQFCIITPTAYLEKYASQSSMHLVLAHLVDTDEAYAEFYAKRDEFKIMDNGAYELGESYAPDKLIALGQKCKADAIVLPDYPFQQAGKTIDESEKMIQPVKDAGFKTMYVPQSERGDFDDWMDGYTWGAYNRDIDIVGMSILALPNALPHIPASYARVVATQLMQSTGRFFEEKYHHYLGLNAGPALELPALLAMNALDSCDSSNPVWAGICGQSYSYDCDSFLRTRKISKHVDFNYPWTNDTHVHQYIQNNINMTLDMFPFNGTYTVSGDTS